MKPVRIKYSIIYAIISITLLFTTERVFGLFFDFSSSKYLLEGFKVVIAVYFILLFFEFRDKLINIGVIAIASAFFLQYLMVFNLTQLTKLIVSIPAIIILIFGLGLLLYGIYRLLRINHQTNDRLRKIALFDPLTQLPNRKFLFQECIYDETKVCEKCTHSSILEYKF